MLNDLGREPEGVGSELRALSAAGPYRFAFHHQSGCIVEYFDSATAALVRGVEIEQWLLAHAPRPGGISVNALAEMGVRDAFSPTYSTESC